MTAFIGIDVGTGSARAGVFNSNGQLLASAHHPIDIWKEAGDIVEQSSDDIWQAVVAATRDAVAAAGIGIDEIAGIGFDATCSLVLVDDLGQPVGVGRSGDDRRNVMVWMDHRAQPQAERINATSHPVLRYVGGVISPEMQTPKLLWLKENLPASFDRARHFFDLVDWLTFKATGSTDRSSCTVTCKWTYLAHEGRWDPTYFKQIGLTVLADEGFARIGTEIVNPGTPLGQGLSAETAQEFGLLAGTAVGAGAIDAHAGGIGTLGAEGRDGHRMAYVFGTSACAMVSSATARFVPGVWGPYYSAMFPDAWLLEGGQSAAGAAIDHIIRSHPFSGSALRMAGDQNISLIAFLERESLARLRTSQEVARFVSNLHVVPEYLGNRSPGADPDARSVIMGQDLSDDFESLCRLYLAALCGLAYGARQIIEAINEQGASVDTLVLSGGAGSSPLVQQLMADATGCKIAIPASDQPVLLGAAILGGLASNQFRGFFDAIESMSTIAETISPSDEIAASIHNAKFAVFVRLQRVHSESRKIMNPGLATSSRGLSGSRDASQSQ